MALASRSCLRIVAISRRDYPGSTPLSPEQNTVLSSGTDDEKAAFLKERGLEIATFIERYARENPIVPINGATGGFALLGWSLGNAFALSVVANLDALSPSSQSWWKDHFRALILYGTFGSPYTPTYIN